MLDLEALSSCALLYMGARQKIDLHIVPESTSYLAFDHNVAALSLGSETKLLCHVWFLPPSGWISAQYFAI